MRYNKIYKFILPIIFICFTLFSFNFVYAAVEYLKSDLKDTNLNLYCNSDIAIDAISGNVLYEKNSHSKVFPASTTKILTAILAIENLDLDKPIVASKNAVYSTPAGSSLMFVKVGEVLSVKQLLYGLLLPSGNDAGNVLAEAVSGSIPKFVELMNTKLKEIGCNDSHFTNAHGFHDKEHYTTAYDMVILMKYAMKYDIFKEICETKYIEIPATNNSEIRKLESTNRMFDKSYTKMYYQYMLGGKTGYTEEARGTFVGYGKKDDKLVIIGAFNGSQNINKQQGRFLDAKTLFNYSFNNFNTEVLLSKSDKIFTIKDKRTSKLYNVGLKEDITTLTKDDEAINKYSLNIDFDKLEKADINKFECIGKLHLLTTGDDINLKNDYDLVYIGVNDMIKPVITYQSILIVIVLILIILFIILIIDFFKRKKKNSKIDYKIIRNNTFKI